MRAAGRTTASGLEVGRIVGMDGWMDGGVLCGVWCGIGTVFYLLQYSVWIFFYKESRSIGCEKMMDGL